MMEDLAEEIKEYNKDKIINELEKENKELKETIINMSKCMFKRDNDLSETVRIIAKELRRISRRK